MVHSTLSSAVLTCPSGQCEAVFSSLSIELFNLAYELPDTSINVNVDVKTQRMADLAVQSICATP